MSPFRRLAFVRLVLGPRAALWGTSTCPGSCVNSCPGGITAPFFGLPPTLSSLLSTRGDRSPHPATGPSVGEGEEEAAVWNTGVRVSGSSSKSLPSSEVTKSFLPEFHSKGDPPPKRLQASDRICGHPCTTNASADVDDRNGTFKRLEDVTSPRPVVTRAGVWCIPQRCRRTTHFQLPNDDTLPAFELGVSGA